jgi:hypothetical protein
MGPSGEQQCGLMNVILHTKRCIDKEDNLSSQFPFPKAPYFQGVRAKRKCRN